MVLTTKGPGNIWAAATEQGRRWKRGSKKANVVELDPETGKEVLVPTTIVPNRRELRVRVGVRGSSIGRPFARITSGTRLTSPEFDTHVCIIQRDENGKTIKKVLVPRNMIEGIRQEPIFPRR